jgi:hypothetical protein
VRFNEGLLRQQSNGKNSLISRLAAVIQVGLRLSHVLCCVLREEVFAACLHSM